MLRTRFRLNCRECRFIANSNCRHGSALFVIDTANATLTIKKKCTHGLCVFKVFGTFEDIATRFIDCFYCIPDDFFSCTPICTATLIYLSINQSILFQAARPIETTTKHTRMTGTDRRTIKKQTENIYR